MSRLALSLALAAVGHEEYSIKLVAERFSDRDL
jgi:hypothetical protein